jgi:hypothetical protein
VATQPAYGNAKDTVHPFTPFLLFAVTLVTLVMGLFGLYASAMTAAGPDSCGEVSCHGDGTRALAFLIAAGLGPVLSLAAWFFMRPSRAAIRYALVTAAVTVPFFADLVLLS